MSRYLTQGKHFSNLQVWFEDEPSVKSEIRGVDALCMHASGISEFSVCGIRAS